MLRLFSVLGLRSWGLSPHTCLVEKPVCERPAVPCARPGRECGNANQRYSSLQVPGFCFRKHSFSRLKCYWVVIVRSAWIKSLSFQLQVGDRFQTNKQTIPTSWGSSVFKSGRRSWSQKVLGSASVAVSAFRGFPHFLGFWGFGFIRVS